MMTQRKRIVRIVTVIVIILAVLLTMHILVNSLDLPGVVRSLHGG